MKKFLTVQEVQDLLGVSRGAVISWIRAGRLRAFKVGGGRLWRVARPEFQRFLKSGAGSRV